VILREINVGLIIARGDRIVVSRADRVVSNIDLDEELKSSRKRAAGVDDSATNRNTVIRRSGSSRGRYLNIDKALGGSRVYPLAPTSARAHNAGLVFLHDAFERRYPYLMRAPNAFKRSSFKFDRRIG